MEARKWILKENREAYFQDIYYTGVNRQLAGDGISLPLTTERLAFHLAERVRIASAMLGHVEFSQQHVVEDMVRLCITGERLPPESIASSFHLMKQSYAVVSTWGRVVELLIDNLRARVLSKRSYIVPSRSSRSSSACMPLSSNYVSRC